MSSSVSSGLVSSDLVSVNIKGGIGNRLFQIAAAYAYARKENGTLKIVRDNISCIQKGYFESNINIYWDTIFSKIKPYTIDTLPYKLDQWHESYPNMYNEISSLTSSGKYLNGYYQTSKYYYNDTIKQEIKELFTPNELLVREILGKYKNLHVKHVVVVHARRTNYIALKDKHGPLDISYYKEAIQKMREMVSNPFFLLCGDDNTFWNELKDELKGEYMILENESDINTFVLLQQFNNFIMSNSTFMWWCVWLSKSINVIAPSKWYGFKGPKLYEDVYEDNWIRI